MAVTTPAYCTRDDVKRALDVLETARENWRIDRAIQSAARNIEGHFHLRFYPEDGTKYFDWPNFDYAYPWKLYLNQYVLAAIPTTVTSGTAGGTQPGQSIPISAINFEPINEGPPFKWLELRRDQPYSFGVGPTPQRDVGITGTFGFWLQTDPAGQLVAAVSTTTGTVVQVSDASLVSPGSILFVDSERMLVTDSATLDTGQTNLTGWTSNSSTDVAGTVADGTQLHVGEVLQIDSERMLIVDITGNTVTVKRAWDGTPPATHTTGTHLYAFRQLTVLRGQLGTAAATHLNTAACSTWRVPSLLRDLAIAEAENRILQEPGGYRDPQGDGSSSTAHLGTALADLWDEAETAYARKNRKRVI